MSKDFLMGGLSNRLCSNTPFGVLGGGGGLAEVSSDTVGGKYIEPQNHIISQDFQSSWLKKQPSKTTSPVHQE